MNEYDKREQMIADMRRAVAEGTYQAHCRVVNQLVWSGFAIFVVYNIEKILSSLGVAAVEILEWLQWALEITLQKPIAAAISWYPVQQTLLALMFLTFGFYAYLILRKCFRLVTGPFRRVSDRRDPPMA